MAVATEVGRVSEDDQLQTTEVDLPSKEVFVINYDILTNTDNDDYLADSRKELHAALTFGVTTVVFLTKDYLTIDLDVTAAALSDFHVQAYDAVMVCNLRKSKTHGENNLKVLLIKKRLQQILKLFIKIFFVIKKIRKNGFLLKKQ